MRNRVVLLIVVLVAVLVAVPAHCADAPPKIDTPENWKAWEAYSRTLLVRMFPERSDSLGERPLLIIGIAAPNAYRHGRNIVITFGIIVTAEDDAEYASVLAHEFSHLWRNHEDTTLWSDLFERAGDDMVMMEKQETEADTDSLVGLRRARMDNPYCAMVIRREAAMLRNCMLK